MHLTRPNMRRELGLLSSVALALVGAALIISGPGNFSVELLGENGVQAAEDRAVKEAFLKGLMLGEQNKQEVSQAGLLNTPATSPNVHQRHQQHRAVDSSGSNRKELDRYDSILTLPRLDSHGDPVSRKTTSHYRQPAVKILPTGSGSSKMSDELKDLSAKASIQQMNMFYNSLQKEQVAIPTGHEKKGLPLENKKLMKKLTERDEPQRVQKTAVSKFKRQLGSLRRAILHMKQSEGAGAGRASESLRSIQSQIHSLEKEFPKDVGSKELEKEKTEIRRTEKADRQKLREAKEAKVCRKWMDQWSTSALGGMEKSCPTDLLSNKHDREQLVLNNHVAALLHRCMGGPGTSGRYPEGVVVSDFVLPWNPVGGTPVHAWVNAKPAGDGIKNLGITTGKTHELTMDHMTLLSGHDVACHPGEPLNAALRPLMSRQKKINAARLEDWEKAAWAGQGSRGRTIIDSSRSGSAVSQPATVILTWKKSDLPPKRKKVSSLNAEFGGWSLNSKPKSLWNEVWSTS